MHKKPDTLQKSKIIAKRLIYKKLDTLQKVRQFPLHFLYKNQNTLCYTIFHENFEFCIYIQQA